MTSPALKAYNAGDVIKMASPAFKLMQEMLLKWHLMHNKPFDTKFSILCCFVKNDVIEELNLLIGV